MISENSVTYQFIGNVTNAGALDSSIDNLPEGAVAIVNAEDHNVRAAGAAVGTRLKIAQRLPGGQLVFSPSFVPNQSTVIRQNYVRPVEQISFLGYNGTAGALDTEDAREYILKLTLNHTQGIYNNTPMIKSVPFYLREYAAGTNARVIQRDLAAGLVDSFKRQFSRTPGNVIKAERVADGAVAVLNDTASLVRVVEGSTTISYHTTTLAGGIVADQGTQVAGDALALPIDNGRVFTVTAIQDLGHIVIIDGVQLNVADAGTADNNAAAIVTAINSSVLSDRVVASAAAAVVTITYRPDFRSLPPIVITDDGAGAEVVRTVATTAGNDRRARYRMEAAITNAATGILDMPWQGPTGYIAVNPNPARGTANNSFGQTAEATAANWGVMFSGRTPLQFNPVSETPFQVSFSLSFDKVRNASDAAFGLLTPALDDSRITYSVNSNPGLGTFPQVGVKEVYTTMNEGNAQICAYPPTNYRRVANIKNTYSVLTINAANANYTTATTGQTPRSLYNISVAVRSDLADVGVIATQIGA